VFHRAVARGEPVAEFRRFVIKRAHAAAIRDSSAFINDVEPFRPGGIGEVGGVAHIVDAEGQGITEAFDKIICNQDALLEVFRLRVADVIFQVGFHLPFVGGMSFTHVDSQKVRVLLVIVKNPNEVANLATERRSSKAPEDQDERARAGSFPKMKTVCSIQRQEPHVRRVTSNLQTSAMHVRQCVAHHAVSVSGTSREIAKGGKSRDQEQCQRRAKPLEEFFQFVLIYSGLPCIEIFGNSMDWVELECQKRREGERECEWREGD